MRPLLVFIVIIAAVFLTGAMLSYPVYVLLSFIIDIDFHKVVHYSILLTGLSLGLYYLRATQTVSVVIGQRNGFKKNLSGLITGFAAGLAILLIIELSLYVLGMRQADPELSDGLIKFLIAVLKAIITGFAVGLLEESLYRGAIYTGLARNTNYITALIVTSLFYGAVHFIDFPELSTGMAVGWTTGFVVLINAFDQFADPLILDSLFSLTVLGLLLGMLRWHTGNIILCIGVHAGIVTINKIFSYSTDFKTGSPYEFLVNSYDHQTGVLASFWLILACVFYYLLFIKKSADQRQENNHS